MLSDCWIHKCPSFLFIQIKRDENTLIDSVSPGESRTELRGVVRLFEGVVQLPPSESTHPVFSRRLRVHSVPTSFPLSGLY